MNSGMDIRSLTIADLEAVLDLQDITISGLKDKSILRKNSSDIFAHALSERNIALGVFDESDLIAVGIAVDPDPPETDLRTNLKKFTVDKAMDLKLIIVKEEYRGNGLQRKLIQLLEEEALSRGVTHFCTSVSPDNPHSFNNFLAMGYEFDHQEELYGGLLRNIYVKKLKLSS